MSKPLDPFSTPRAWREFLYNSVLLPHETKSLKVKSGNYDAKVIVGNLGLYAVKVEKLSDLQPLEVQYETCTDEFLVFYSDERGLSSIFKRLRDMTAHGHYSNRDSNWITIRHRFKGRNEKVESTRLFGHLRFQTLKDLVEFINVAHTK